MDEPATTRAETFSDGVFAIAATLLVLEIGVGAVRGDLGGALLRLWPSYLAYATSFLTIGIMWVNHHACFERIVRVDRTFLFLNSLLLMLVAFVPFPTRLVAEFLNHAGERSAVLAYGITMTLTAIAYNALWLYAARGRRLIADDVPQPRVDEITRSYVGGPAIYGAGALIGLASPVASIFVYLAVAAFYVPAASLWMRA